MLTAKLPVTASGQTMYRDEKLERQISVTTVNINDAKHKHNASPSARSYSNAGDRFPEPVSPRFREIIAQGRGTSAAACREAHENARYFCANLVELLRPGSIILAPATDGIAPQFSGLTGSQMLQGLWRLAGRRSRYPAATLMGSRSAGS